MTDLTPLFPRRAVPELAVATVEGATWRLADQTPESFTLVVFYRGLHCPICANYIRDLDRKLGDFEALGVSVAAVSSDDQARATQTKADWGLERVTLGYGLDLDAARTWGLYISSGRGKTSIGIEEPAQFSEPALYLVRPDGTLYFGSVQTMPFARPNFGEILKAIQFVIDKGYPARGEVIDPQAASAA